MSEHKFSEFVESMQRLYGSNQLQDKFIEGLLENKKITLDEYLYIMNRKEV